MIRNLSTNLKKYSANVVLSRTKIARRIAEASSGNSRKFCVSSAGNSSIKAVVDSNNIFRSPFEDIENISGLYLHDHVWQNLHRWPDKTALVCTATGRSYTYSEVRKAAGRLATSLRKKCKLYPGDTVAAVLPNLPEFASLIFGVSEAGLKLVLINPASTSHEISTYLKNSDASVVFTTTSKYPVVVASKADNSAIKLPIIVIEDGNVEAAEGTIKFSDLIREDIEEFEKTGEKTGTDPEDTFLMPLSSGTSGLPKIVELSHRNIVANLKQLREKEVNSGMEASANYQDILPLILPMYHIYGLVVGFNHHFSLGAKLLCVPQFSADNLFKILEQNRLTLFHLAPPLIQLMVNDQRLKKNHLESIKTMISGAAPIGEEVLGKFMKCVPSNMKMIQGYGLSECSPVVTLSRESPLTALGRPLPNTDLRIVGHHAKNEGINLSFNQVGEIYVRGPQVMIGYYKNPASTADCMEGDWFKTGDLGSVDENGFLYMQGRLKELIKVQSYQVAPAEIEDLIQGHEKVADAAVVGVPHEKYGEVPKAFVVTKKGVKLEPDEIKNWVAQHFVKYKHLGHVQFIDAIPKSPAGKILRMKLKKM